ncbi:MAG TPA: hypothetical protein VLB09_09465, partial [Nitrospiria bacterium]|nr:hypothetical protein [Nitrospiria bacterium]
ITALLILAGCQSTPQVSPAAAEVEAEQDAEGPTFNSEDRRRIRNYFVSRARAFPPDRPKEKPLPPEIQKKLVRDGTLPPGLKKESFPNVLVQQLEFLPAGYVRLKVGNNVVLIHQETEVIVDIIYEVDQ